MELGYFIDLEKNMKNQITFYDRVLEVNDGFKKCLIDRNWTGVNSNIELLNQLSVEVNKLDSERVDILIEIAGYVKSKESENLLSIIKKAPEEIKYDLLEIFYTLKTLVIQIQGVFKGIGNYIEYKKDLSKEVIDILVKDAKGNVYSKPGRRESEGHGFLVNRQL